MKYYYILILIVFSFGTSMVFGSRYYLKKLIGLSIVQSSVILFYLGFAKTIGSVTPILKNTQQKLQYTAPLPSVLMLTAIVVGFGCFCVGLSIINKIYDKFKTLDVKKLNDID